jgi:phosphomannomutase
MISTKGFKAYDIRGVVPTEVNEDLAYRLARSLSFFLKAKHIVVGHDIRLSGPSLTEAAVRGFCDMGVHVTDLGQCGTEMMYFAVAHLKADGGMMITASHNPAEYNGMKLVRKESRPISADTGLKDLAAMVIDPDFENKYPKASQKGDCEHIDIVPDYISHLLTYIDVESVKPLNIVANPGNGGAGPIVKELAKHLPCHFTYINDEPDGHFPNGVPNPLLPENRDVTSNAVRQAGADLGIAWDGDFDRCFFFDEHGRFIEGYYLVGLFAQYFLKRNPGCRILYDPRLTWNTEDIIAREGGEPVRCKSGHAFIKECMRRKHVIYGGEMSAHHYFANFSYCDSGMIPWLLLVSILSTSGLTLSQMVDARIREYPCSGEINRKVPDADAVLDKLAKHYSSGIQDHMDGISVVYDEWRFNVRKSNTEPVVRLNVETRGDRELLEQKTRELLDLIQGEKA